MSLNVDDKTPNFGTSFGVLEAESKVYAVRLGPDDKGFCMEMSLALRGRRDAPCCRW